MKTIFLTVLILSTQLGCAGPIIGLAMIAAANKSAEETPVWSAKVSRMNCSQLRRELISLNKKKNVLGVLMPGQASAKRGAVKSVMIQRGCRLPA